MQGAPRAGGHGPSWSGVLSLPGLSTLGEGNGWFAFLWSELWLPLDLPEGFRALICSGLLCPCLQLSGEAPAAKAGGEGGRFLPGRGMLVKNKLEVAR